MNPFDGLSQKDLQSALLQYLSELANLRAESKTLRARLALTRSALQRVRYALSQIEHALTIENIIAFPQAKPVPEPTLIRKIGRWGKVTWELEEPIPSSPRKHALSSQ